MEAKWKSLCTHPTMKEAEQRLSFASASVAAAVVSCAVVVCAAVVAVVVLWEEHAVASAMIPAMQVVRSNFFFIII